MTLIPKFQMPAQTITMQSDNTRVVRQPVVFPVKYKPRPGEFIWTNRDGTKQVIRSKNEQMSEDKRSDKQRKQDQKYAQQKREQIQLQQAEEKTAKIAGEVVDRAMPSTVARAVYDAATGNKSFAGSMIEGNEGLGDPALNLAFDIAVPYGLSLLGKGMKYTGKGIDYLARMNQQRKFSGDITERFLKFTGGNGNPVSPAIPRTEEQLEMYAQLKAAGVNMDKISIEDINKALQLREEALLSSGKSFSYQQPVTSNSEIIYSIDDGYKTGYIDLRKPYLTNDRGFSQEIWESYKNNPRKKGLSIGMIKNYTQTIPNAYPKQYKGIQERLTNSAIDVAKQQGYEGVVSGEALLSPEKTTRMYPKYKHKRIIDQNGRYHWQNHNPGMPEQSGPVYMLEEPTYETIIKSKVFNPNIIDSKGKMRINWGKGRTMFNSFVVPTVFGTYLLADQK